MSSEIKQGVLFNSFDSKDVLRSQLDLKKVVEIRDHAASTGHATYTKAFDFLLNLVNDLEKKES